MIDRNKIKALLKSKSEPVKSEGNDIYLYGVIGDLFDEADAKSFIDRLNAIEGDVTVRVNSPGGDAFDGIAIMNALKQRKGKVTAIVEGLAASAASIVVLGGADEIRMLEGSQLMIHNAWTIVMGNSNELRKTADDLEQLSNELAKIYSRVSNKSVEEIKKAMDKETWFTATKAKDFGFNVVAEEEEAKIKDFNMLSIYNNVPEDYRIRAKAEKPKNVRELEALLKKSGFSNNEAKKIASVPQVKSILEPRDEAKEENSAMLDKLSEAISKNIEILKGE